MKKLVLGFMLTFAVLGLYAQNITVTGKVTDETGAPLEGVSIKLKGANKGTQSDKGGAFQISVAPTGSVLTFTFVLVKFYYASRPICKSNGSRNILCQYL